MRKLLLLLTIIFSFSALFYLLIRNYYHIDERFALSLLQKPGKDVTKMLPQGSDLNQPFSLPQGFRLAVYADLKDYGMPRVLAFDPQGVLFATLTKQGKLVAMPDNNNDGISDAVVVVKDNLNNPHGIEFYNGKFYLAETDKITTYDYNSELYELANEEKIIDLPAGARHFTRTIKIIKDKLYTSIGSSCDVCLEKNEKHASILVSNLDGSDLKIFAKGLRNTVFFAADVKGFIWGNDMGRDFLGDELPPDELNIIQAGRNYGWPYCYGAKVRDKKFRVLEALDRCNPTTASVFDYPAHVAPLGLVFINSQLFLENDQGNLLSCFHGSWNSSVPVGYKIVKLDIEDGKVIKMEDFISGWLSSDNGILGRPVDLVFDDLGLLYISDDRAGVVYILTKENKS